MADEQRRTCDTEENAAGDSKAAFPDLVPLRDRHPISDQVVDPGPDDSCRNYPHQYFDGYVWMKTPFDRALPRNHRCSDNAEPDHEPVQREAKRADVNCVEGRARDGPNPRWAKR